MSKRIKARMVLVAAAATSFWLLSVLPAIADMPCLGCRAPLP